MVGLGKYPEIHVDDVAARSLITCRYFHGQMT